MEPAAAPMISVPKGVIKEFVSNSPSPSPSLVNNESTAADSPKVASQTRTPSPDLPNSGSDSALPTDPPNHVVNGVTQNTNESTENTENSSVKDSVITNNSDSTKDSQQLNLTNSDTTEKRLNGTVTPSLKRPSDQSEASYPDLKKVRVFFDKKVCIVLAHSFL